MITSITQVYTFGALSVYQRTTLEFPMGNGKFYYLDKRYMIEQGPFDSIYDAVDHWQNLTIPIIMEQKLEGGETVPIDQPTEAVPNNVIYVDFQLKRRKSTP